MIKRFYVLAWFVLIGSTAAAVLTGTLNELAMVAFGLVALGSVYALGLWAVLVDMGTAEPG